MSELQNQFSKVRRGCKKRIQLNANENVSADKWMFNFSEWNCQDIRRPLGELSNTCTKTLTQTPNVSDSSTEKKPRDHDSTDQNNITRRNERERNRVKLLNMGFDRLRAVVPCRSGEQLSKISTLKKAIWYIEHLDKVLHGQENSCSDLADQSTLSPMPQSPTSNKSIINVKGQAKSITPKSAGLFGINHREARSGTSWSSFEKDISPTKNTSIQERRSVNQPYMSPVFPTYWDYTSSNGIPPTREMFSTPKLASTPSITKHVRHTDGITNSFPSPSDFSVSESRSDSGYNSPMFGSRLPSEVNFFPVSKRYLSYFSTPTTTAVANLLNPVYASPVSTSDRMILSEYNSSHNFPRTPWSLSDNCPQKPS
uniref:BHLH domain-containing protein n=1 Tax=Trichobilharzia regenti TaxID=157069 RepID=A0AA85JZ10_TRIRE|nr:unnamed protein product [Trichobilharzia regenti]